MAYYKILKNMAEFLESKTLVIGVGFKFNRQIKRPPDPLQSDASKYSRRSFLHLGASGTRCKATGHCQNV